MNKEFENWLEEQTYKINSKIHPPNKGKDRIDWVDETYWSKNRYINPEFKQWLTEQKYYRAISNIEYWVVWPYFYSQKDYTWERMLREPKWK